MSQVKTHLIWQHEKVLPYLFGELKTKIEAVRPVEKIYLFGSRAKTPVSEWTQLEGKDWDILVIAGFPIVNTKVWTSQMGYHIDLIIRDNKNPIYYPNWIELFPNNFLNLTS